VHCGRKCTPEIQTSYSSFFPLNIAKALGVKDAVSCALPHLGSIIPLDVRQVVWFSSILQNIIATVDTELIYSQPSYSFFLSQVKGSPYFSPSSKVSREVFNKCLDRFFEGSQLFRPTAFSSFQSDLFSLLYPTQAQF